MSSSDLTDKSKHDMCDNLAYVIVNELSFVDYQFETFETEIDE